MAVGILAAPPMKPRWPRSRIKPCTANETGGVECQDGAQSRTDSVTPHTISSQDPEPEQTHPALKPSPRACSRPEAAIPDPDRTGPLLAPWILPRNGRGALPRFEPLHGATQVCTPDCAGVGTLSIFPSTPYMALRALSMSLIAETMRPSRLRRRRVEGVS